MNSSIAGKSDIIIEHVSKSNTPVEIKTYPELSDLIQVAEHHNTNNDAIDEIMQYTITNINERKSVITTSEYWDCECDSHGDFNYIHHNSVNQCPICGALECDQPDSRLNEVISMLIYYS